MGRKEGACVVGPAWDGEQDKGGSDNNHTPQLSSSHSHIHILKECQARNLTPGSPKTTELTARARPNAQPPNTARQLVSYCGSQRMAVF